MIRTEWVIWKQIKVVYVALLKKYMIEKESSDEDLKQYDPILQDKVRTGMYKEIIGYYVSNATSIKKAINDNKTFLTRYINNLRA